MTHTWKCERQLSHAQQGNGWSDEQLLLDCFQIEMLKVRATGVRRHTASPGPGSPFHFLKMSLLELHSRLELSAALISASVRGCFFSAYLMDYWWVSNNTRHWQSRSQSDDVTTSADALWRRSFFWSARSSVLIMLRLSRQEHLVSLKIRQTPKRRLLDNHLSLHAGEIALKGPEVWEKSKML